MNNCIKEQSSTIYHAKMPLAHKTRDQMDIFHEFINVGENCIAISNDRKVSNEIHGPYIKLRGCNRNRIQQPMRSISKVLAPLIHATTLDELFHISDYTYPLHIISKSLECLKNAQVACKVTAMKLSK